MHPAHAFPHGFRVGLRDPDAVPLLQVPELVVEVLSQKRTYDRFAKRVVYSAVRGLCPP